MSTRNGNRGAQNNLFDLIALDEEMRRANILPVAHVAGARRHAHYNGPSLFELVEMDETRARHPSPHRYSSPSPKRSPNNKTPNNKGTPSRLFLAAHYSTGSNGEMLPPTPVLTPIFTPVKRHRTPGTRTGQKTQPLFPDSHHATRYTPRTLQRLYTTPDEGDALSVLSVPEMDKTVLLMRRGQRIMTPSNLKMINASTPSSPYGWSRVGNHVRTVGVRRARHRDAEPIHSPRTKVPSSARKSQQATPRKITIVETNATPGEKLKLVISSSAKKSQKNTTPAGDKYSAVRRNQTM